MRASKKAKRQVAMTSLRGHDVREIHISGAEGIYDGKEIARIVSQYAIRALSHQKGRPDSIIITVEEVKQKPRAIQSLPVTTLACRSPLQARGLIRKLLVFSGISDRAISTAFTVTNSSITMRGAALILCGSGRRVEPDKPRGIRVSRLGISNHADTTLSRKLAHRGMNNSTVKEAIILASKVAACRQVIAELCVSDDPEYTTGYVSSGRYGYVRIPHIKKKGEKKGGRVFFLEEGADIDFVTGFLEKTPVIIDSLSPCYGVRTIYEIIDRIDK